MYELPISFLWLLKSLNLLQVDAVCEAARRMDAEVVICTYDCLRVNVGVMATVPWMAAIFDEVRFPRSC